MLIKKRITKEEALKKAESYCVYRERCQQEVRSKIYEWGLHSNEVESIIATLISTNFINEERFAKAYAGGKFRIKKWGRNRIVLELKKRNLSSYCINKAMDEIKNDYRAVLEKIILRKNDEVKEKNPLKKQEKIVRYAINKGFEPELVWEVVKNKN